MKYSREVYNLILMEQQQLYELWQKAKLLKSKKTPESSKTLEARMAVL